MYWYCSLWFLCCQGWHLWCLMYERPRPEFGVQLILFLLSTLLHVNVLIWKLRSTYTHHIKITCYEQGSGCYLKIQSLIFDIIPAYIYACSFLYTVMVYKFMCHSISQHGWLSWLCQPEHVALKYLVFAIKKEKKKLKNQTFYIDLAQGCFVAYDRLYFKLWFLHNQKVCDIS